MPTSTYLREQLTLRDTKIVTMEQSISQLIQAVRGLQQRWWQPVSIIDMPDIQQQFEPLGSYMTALGLLADLKETRKVVC